MCRFLRIYILSLSDVIMKKLLIGVYLFSIALLFSACTALPESGGVSYISSQSYVSGDKYSLCFENTTEKALEFCIYGVFRDNNRAVGLDENGIMKTAVINRYSKTNIDFYFNGTSSRMVPYDVIIIGEYK